jgi:hypothetical protein
LLFDQDQTASAVQGILRECEEEHKVEDDQGSADHPPLTPLEQVNRFFCSVP